MKMAGAFLVAALLMVCGSALAQTRYGTVLLNNYDSGKGIFWYNCPAAVGTIVEVLGGPNAGSLAVIASTFPGASTYTIQEGDVNALGPGTGSFFDNGFGSVPGVLPGATATLLVRAWVGAASYDQGFERSSVIWTQATGTNPDPPELPQPAALRIPNIVLIHILTPFVLVSPSQVIVGGQTAIFTATTRFPANPIAYQWSKDCVDLKDATNATLTLTNVRRTDAGGFDVTVVDISGQPFRGLRSMLRVLVPQRFEAPTLLADGRLRLPFRDQDGDVATLSYATNYFVPQMSTNLVNWQAASGRLSLTNGFLVFEENTPLVAASRFYRIVEP